MAQVAAFAGTPLDISDFPTRHPYGLGLWQNHIERILAGWVDELAVPIYREREVTGFAQDDSGVDVELSDGASLRAEYLVGCDGGRSVVRKAAGIEFAGWDPTTSSLLAEVEMAEEPELGMRRTAFGIHSLGKVEYEIREGEVVYGEGGTVRVMVTEEHVGPTSEPTLRDLSEGLIAVYGTDYGIHSPTWITRFTDLTRQAAAYRDRRILLAGDAAHVHSPVGGQGLNTGVQDAVNLGWKLAQVVNGTSTGQPPRHLPRRAPSGRRPRAAQHDGAGRALPPGRPHRGGARHRVRAPRHGRAAQAVRRDDVRPRHPLRPRRGTPAARAPHARSRPGHPRWDGASVHPPPRRPPGPSEPGRALGFRHLPLGRPSVGDRRRLCRRVGASGPGPSGRPRCRADQARRLRRLGGGRHGDRIARRADYVVRITLERRPRSRRRGRSSPGGCGCSPGSTTSSTRRSSRRAARA